MHCVFPAKKAKNVYTHIQHSNRKVGRDYKIALIKTLKNIDSKREF